MHSHHIPALHTVTNFSNLFESLRLGNKTLIGSPAYLSNADIVVRFVRKIDHKSTNHRKNTLALNSLGQDHATL